MTYVVLACHPTTPCGDDWLSHKLEGYREKRLETLSSAGPLRPEDGEREGVGGGGSRNTMVLWWRNSIFWSDFISGPLNHGDAAVSGFDVANGASEN